MKILLLASFALITLYSLVFLKSYHPMPSDAFIGASDGIVLLAGQYLERAPKAAEMFSKRYAPLIIVANDGVRSGWSKEHQRNLYSIERSEKLLVLLGVSRESIIKLPYYKSGTIYDALAVRNYVIEHDLKSLQLVTSDYHVYRTLWVFKRVFSKVPVTITVSGVPSAFISPPRLMEPIKIVYYYLWSMVLPV